MKPNPFGGVEDWKPLEDFCESVVEKAFPNDPLAKWHSGITFHSDGRVVVSYNGKDIAV